MSFLIPLDLQFFAHKKSGGSASTNRSHDSRSKRRGLKRHDGQSVFSGCIIVRQLGSKYLPGKNAYLSKDWTIHAGKNGILKFYQKNVCHRRKTFVEVV